MIGEPLAKFVFGHPFGHVGASNMLGSHLETISPAGGIGSDTRNCIGGGGGTLGMNRLIGILLADLPP